MFLNRDGEKVKDLPVLDSFVDVKEDDYYVSERYDAYIHSEETDVIVGVERFSNNPTEAQIKWCLHKGREAVCSDADVYVRVVKKYILDL